jgi:hypothetical protein
MAKQWTSERGKQHGGQPWSLSTLKLLLTNVLYRGDKRLIVLGLSLTAIFAQKNGFRRNLLDELFHERH